jgi:hypothetical protein
MKKKKVSQDRINTQNTRYSCYLNPFSDYDFSHCPKCDSKIKIKDKLFYLVVMVNHRLIVNMNLNCQFCQGCNLIFVKKRELESSLLYACEQHNFSELIGTDYSVLGLTNKEIWKKNLEKAGSSRQMIDHFNLIENVYEPVGIKIF